MRRHDPLDLESVVDFEEIVTCLPVIQELLQGIGDPMHFRRAEESMKALPIVESPMGADLFDEAIDLCRTARSAGVTVRSSVDCVIAACALRNDLEVLHSDRDFAHLAEITRLRSRSL